MKLISWQIWVRFTAGELIHRSCVIPASFSVFFALDLDPSLTLVVHLCRLLLWIISSDERKQRGFWDRTAVAVWLGLRDVKGGWGGVFWQTWWRFCVCLSTVVCGKILWFTMENDWVFTPHLKNKAQATTCTVEDVLLTPLSMGCLLVELYIVIIREQCNDVCTAKLHSKTYFVKM